MRCLYCNGWNQERAAYCVSCGRDLRKPQPNSQTQRPPAFVPPRPGNPVNPPVQQPRSGSPINQPVQQTGRVSNPPVQQTAPAGRRQAVAASRIAAPAPLVPVPPPESPVPFPPRTMDQFNALLAAGAQSYKIVESSMESGKKKLVRIVFSADADWQQAATLLRALRDQPDEKLNTIIIQGVRSQQEGLYAFTNGQLQLDRNVRLGSQVSSRYIVETGNGFASDSLRFVLNE